MTEREKPSRTTRYEVRDPAGVLAAIHTRFDYADGSKDFSWATPSCSTGLGGVKVVDLPLFGVHALPIKPSNVLLVEGEKAQLAVAGQDLVAVATVCGSASTPSDEVLRALTGHCVYVWPDADETGRKHMDRIGQALVRLGADVRVIDWTGAREKGDDAYDFFARGGTVEDVRALMQKAQKFGSNSEDRNSAKKAEPWATVKPLGVIGDPPKFNIDAMFPEALAPIRFYVEALAANLQIAPEAPAVLCLAILASAMAQKFEAAPTRTWIERLAIFAVVVLPPGNLKSALIAAFTRAIAAWEKDRAMAEASVIAKAHEERELQKKQLERLRKTAAQEPKNAKDKAECESARDEAKRIAIEMEQTKLPTYTRALASDITPESLAARLAENSERILIASSEADFLDVVLGRYSNGKPNLSLVLKAWTGDHHRHDRVGGPPIHLRSPLLSLALAVQPNALEETYSSEAARGRGFTARLLLVTPKSRVSERETMTGPSLAEHVERRFDEVVRRLLDLPIPEEPRKVPITAEAYDQVQGFHSWIEPQLGVYGALADHAEWGSKAKGTLVRIACIFAVAERLGINNERPDKADIRIQVEHVVAARAWMEYLAGQQVHSAKVLGIAPEVSNAGRLLAWIEKERLAEFTGRDALTARSCRAMDTQEETDEAIQVLVDHRIVRCRPDTEPRSPKGGRKLSPTYEVNPSIHGLQNQQNQHNTPPDGSSARSADRPIRVFESILSRSDSGSESLPAGLQNQQNPREPGADDGDMPDSVAASVGASVVDDHLDALADAEAAEQHRNGVLS